MLGRDHAGSPQREIRWRELKGVIARKADPKLEHELQVARCLAVAFGAQGHGSGMDYPRKKYAHMAVGSFWIDIAHQVIAHMRQGGRQPEFSATIQ